MIDFIPFGMAFNYFIGWTEKDLQAALRLAQEDLAAGKTTSHASASGVAKESTVQMSPGARIQMIGRALNRIDPVRYPLDQVTEISEVQVAFS